MESKEYYLLFGGHFTPKALFAQKFCEKYNFRYISVGRLMLEMSAIAQENQFPDSFTEEDRINITDLSQLVLHRQDVPSKLLAWLISHVISQDTKNKFFLIDGYPRNSDEFYDLTDIEAECKGAVYIRIDDHDVKAKFIEQREKTKAERLTDNYILSSISSFHRTHDEIFTKLMMTSTFISIDSKLPIDEMIEQCHKEMEENKDE